MYLSHGITSRGRIGIDNTLYGKVLTNPWFQDPVDKAVLITGINNLLSTMSSVSGLTMITPDNTTTITDYGKSTLNVMSDMLTLVSHAL